MVKLTTLLKQIDNALTKYPWGLEISEKHDNLLHKTEFYHGLNKMNLSIERSSSGKILRTIEEDYSGRFTVGHRSGVVHTYVTSPVSRKYVHEWEGKEGKEAKPTDSSEFYLQFSVSCYEDCNPLSDRFNKLNNAAQFDMSLFHVYSDRSGRYDKDKAMLSFHYMAHKGSLFTVDHLNGVDTSIPPLFYASLDSLAVHGIENEVKSFCSQHREINGLKIRSKNSSDDKQRYVCLELDRNILKSQLQLSRPITTEKLFPKLKSRDITSATEAFKLLVNVYDTILKINENKK